MQAWLVWLSWLEPWWVTKRLQVGFPVRAHTLVVGTIPSSGAGKPSPDTYDHCLVAVLLSGQVQEAISNAFLSHYVSLPSFISKRCLCYGPGPQLRGCKRQPIHVSLTHQCCSLFLSLSLKIKSLKKKKNRKKKKFNVLFCLFV